VKQKERNCFAGGDWKLTSLIEKTIFDWSEKDIAGIHRNKRNFLKGSRRYYWHHHVPGKGGLLLGPSCQLG